MPANLTPEYMSAEKAFKAAKSDSEKLECLREMLSAIPKHKGTDKMQADIKRRISKFRQRIEQHSRGRRGISYHVSKEGAGQVAFAGPPNAGKSRLIEQLTDARPEVAPYPFSTREPHPAMMPYLDIRVQLVDLPPVSIEHTEHWVYDVIKAADIVALVVNVAGARPVDEFAETLSLLRKKNIHIAGDKDLEELPRGAVVLKAMIVATHAEEDPDGELLSLFRELSGTHLEIVPVSAVDNQGMEMLRKRLFEMLEVIRVYSRPPGKKIDEGEPYALPAGTTLMGFAEHVHKDFAVNLRFARCWGSSKFEGQAIPHDHVLQDGDIIELHI